MPMEIVTVPCLDDNYAYLVKGPDGVCLIDAPDAPPIEAALDARGWGLDTILVTHHHWDHVDGIEPLRARYGCRVIGPAAEAVTCPCRNPTAEDLECQCREFGPSGSEVPVPGFP